jgi:hypothetical protein
MEPLNYNPYRETEDRQPLPWLLARANAGQKQVNQEKDIPESNSFAVMMNASRQQALRTKQKAGDPTRSVTAKMAAASRTANKKRQKEQQPDTSSGTSGDWQKHSLDFIQRMLDRLKPEVNFNPRGNHELQGSWPDIHYCYLIEPSADVITWKKKVAVEGETVAFDDAVKEDFALPAFMLWAPENRWPDLYPEERPKCPFHKAFNCVEHLGIGNHVRRCYGRNGNVALAKRRYKCTIRETTKEHPYCFDSAQKEVMDNAPDYVQGYWREHGFNLSHRCAVSYAQFYTSGKAA